MLYLQISLPFVIMVKQINCLSCSKTKAWREDTYMRYYGREKNNLLSVSIWLFYLQLMYDITYITTVFLLLHLLNGL